jgi:hypothetical protein
VTGAKKLKNLVNTLVAAVLIQVSWKYSFDPSILEIGQEGCFNDF